MSNAFGLGAAADLFREKLYVFTYDFLHQITNSEVISQYIRDARTLSSWSYIGPGVYLLRSYSSAADLSDALRKVTGGAKLLVIEATADNVGGTGYTTSRQKTPWRWTCHHRGSSIGLREIN